MRPGLHQIGVPVGSTDGDVPAYNSATNELELVAPTSLAKHVPLTTIGPDGPGILFAADGHIIYVEAP